MAKTEKIIRALASGTGRRTVAEKLGVSRPHIDKVAREHGAEIAETAAGLRILDALIADGKGNLPLDEIKLRDVKRAMKKFEDHSRERPAER